MGSGQGNPGSASNQPSASMQTGSMGSSSGISGLADIYRIQIEAGELENNIAFSKSQMNTVIARFNSYLNRHPSSPVFTGDTLQSDSLIFPLNSVSDSILANNPMLSMLGFEIQSLEHNIRCDVCKKKGGDPVLPYSFTEPASRPRTK